MHHLPNIITIIRLLLIFPIVWCLLGERYLLGLYLFLFAGLSDGVDGLLARRYAWVSTFGKFADPLADKLLVVIVFSVLVYLNMTPLWLLLLLISREVIITSGFLLYLKWFQHFPVHPSLLSKLNTAVQIAYIVLVLLQLNYQSFPILLVNILLVLLVMTTMLSVIHYIWVWGWKIWWQRLEIRWPINKSDE